MKKKTDSHRQLHLVTEEDAPTAAQQPTDSLIVQGLRRYEQLQAEVDRALFATPQDIPTLQELMPEMQLLRQRLASYGVHVRP